MKRACLAIGVGDAPNLDYLAGAVTGAKAIADWARGPGADGKPRFETVLLTDELDPVGLPEVKAALEGLLGGGAERLLLYFAGHGLSSDAGADFWLPSDWNRTRLAISVGGLRDRLLRYGLERLVIVSDACRMLLDANTRDVVGMPVLDRGPFDEKRPQLDEWKAASPARAAWMIPEGGGAPARCVFSGLLAEALAGAHAAAFENEDRGQPLSNFSLADFLEREVPKVAGRYGADLKPDITTSIRPPANRYMEKGPEPAPAPLPWPDPAGATVTGMGAANAGRIAPPAGRSWTTKDVPIAAPAPAAPTRGGTRGPTRGGGGLGGLLGTILGSIGLKSAKRDADITLSTEGINLDDILGSLKREGTPAAQAGPSLEAIKVADAEAAGAREATRAADVPVMAEAFRLEARPDHFESGAGFTIAGALGAEAWLGPPAVAVKLGDSGYWRVEPGGSVASDDPWWGQGWPIRAPLPLLVRLDDGRYLGAAALPRFVLSFSVGSEGADAVIYRSYDVPYAPDTERVMAELRVAGLGTGQTAEVVSRLRGAKHADPMLGVLAAYLHDAMGDWANVARTAWFFAERGEPVPFDIAMLGRFSARREANGLVTIAIPATEADEGARGLPSWMRVATPEGRGVVAGAFPWMRQGWARLDEEGFEGLYPPGLARLAGRLLPAPFTTLDATGGKLLKALLWGGTP